MAHELTVTQQAAVSIRNLVESDGYRKRFESMLGPKRAPAFIASIGNIVSQSDELAACDPRSIILCAVMAATLDFPIEKSLGFVYIVAYGKTATFQLGYKGLIQLALRSGQYASMRDAAVNAEAFKGYDEAGEPIIDWTALDETKPPVGYVFAFRTNNGFRKVTYWSREKCMAHGKKFSRGFSSSRSPWQSSFDAMALKTVIRAALSKYGILSVELQTAMGAEDVELRQEGDNLIPAGPSLSTAEQPALQEDTRTMSEKLGTKAAPKTVTQEPPAEPPAPEKPAEPAATVETSNGPAEVSVDRDALIGRMEEAMLDGRVSESKLMAYAAKIPGLVPDGITAFNELPTTSLVKLEPAIKALAKK